MIKWSNVETKVSPIWKADTYLVWKMEVRCWFLDNNSNNKKRWLFMFSVFVILAWVSISSHSTRRMRVDQVFLKAFPFASVDECIFYFIVHSTEILFTIGSPTQSYMKYCITLDTNLYIDWLVFLFGSFFLKTFHFCFWHSLFLVWYSYIFFAAHRACLEQSVMEQVISLSRIRSGWICERTRKITNWTKIHNLH